MSLTDNGPHHDTPDETNELEKALDLAAECLDVVLRNRGLTLDRVLVSARVKDPQDGHRDAAFLFSVTGDDDQDLNDDDWRTELILTLERLHRAALDAPDR